MAIPAPRQDPAEQQASFARISGLLDSLKQPPEGRPKLKGALDTLSMGMSADAEAAIAAGATMVRIGTDIFGPRAASSTT